MLASAIQPSESPNVLSLNDLHEIVERRRAAGEIAALSNGCFDLLHVGHVRSLQDARDRADYLIVAINGDASVRRAKGEARPVYPASERAEMLVALQAVDYVVVFDDDTVDGVLELLQPELYAKGTDYTKATIPETPTVERYGGQVVIVGDPKRHSTRQTLEKIQTKGKA